MIDQGRYDGHLNANGAPKVPFPTKADAKRHIKKSPLRREKLHAYHCRQCPYFHFGNRP